ncbi:hypothetical protein CCACVL1_30299 [Corchorus capsularis]|uniref:Uncharacterized protein n=1 Tax=Corchorus capsularis TaxID=210143 RepID=A0A1R3FY05_COCAP|nr:hypothetical protein CCACVL1_30299 [Corchorus capsularis]
MSVIKDISFCRFCSDHGLYCDIRQPPFEEKERLSAIRDSLKDVEHLLLHLQMFQKSIEFLVPRDIDVSEADKLDPNIICAFLKVWNRRIMWNQWRTMLHFEYLSVLRHRLMMEVIPDSADLSFTADFDLSSSMSP